MTDNQEVKASAPIKFWSPAQFPDMGQLSESIGQLGKGPA